MIAIQGGVEYRVSDNLSWYNELGVKCGGNKVNQTDSNFIGSGGFKLKSELRYYLQREGRKHFAEPGHYLAANVFFIHDNYNTQIGYSSGTQSDLVDALGVKKRVLGANILAGWQTPIYKNLLIDVYMGIGIRYRYITTVDETFNPSTDKWTYSVGDNMLSSLVAGIDTKPGGSIMPNFTTGIRLCYKF